MKSNALKPVPAGYRVKIMHWHSKQDLAALAKKPPKYATVAVLVDESTGLPVAAETAFCSPKDQPNRKLGRAIAHNRVVTHYFKDMRDELAREMGRWLDSCGA